MELSQHKVHVVPVHVSLCIYVCLTANPGHGGGGGGVNQSCSGRAPSPTFGSEELSCMDKNVRTILDS